MPRTTTIKRRISIRDEEDCLLFDGDGDKVTVPYDKIPDIDVEGTISFWIKFGSDQSSPKAFIDCQWGDDNAGGWQFLKEPYRTFKAFCGDYSGRDSTTTVKYIPGIWYFLTLSKNSSSVMTIYVNSIVKERRTNCDYGIKSPATDRNLLIGGNRTGGDEARVSMRDVMIFDAELTDTEISDLYYEKKIPASLKFHLPLDEGAGSTVLERVANNSFNITGATWSTKGPIKARTASGRRISIRDEEDCLKMSQLSYVQITNPGINITEFSVSFNASTVKNTLNSGYNDWLSLNGAGGGEICLETNGSLAKPALYIISGFSGAGEINTVTKVLANTGWKKFHLVASKTGNYVRLYINSLLVGSSTWNPGSELISSIRVGNRGSTATRGIFGLMNRVRIYSSPLTQSEIEDEFYDDVVNTSKLVAQYKLDEGSGTVATDSSGNGNNGVITVATWSTAGPIKLRTAI